MLQSPDSPGGLNRLLSWARALVYAGAGFGPMGLAALLSGAEFWPALFWALGGGAASWGLFRLLRRTLTKSLDSSVSEDQLFGAEAELLTPLEAGALAQVRVLGVTGQIERYVRLRDPKMALPTGTKVRLDEYLAETSEWIVEKEQ